MTRELQQARFDNKQSYIAHVFNHYQTNGVTTKHQKEKEYRDKLKRMADQAHAKREKEKREAEERNWKQYLVLPPVKQPHPLEQQQLEMQPEIMFEDLSKNGGEEQEGGLSRIEPQSMIIFKDNQQDSTDDLNNNTFISDGVSVRDLLKINSKKEIKMKSNRLRHSVYDRARSTLLKDKAYNLSLRKV